MIFGDQLEPAEGTDPADWIEPARSGEPWTVGQLVPSHYESYLRLSPPPGGTEDWWTDYCEFFRTVTSIAQEHTDTPHQAWFAIWEGHGFTSFSSHVAHRGPIDEATQSALELERERLRRRDEEQKAATHKTLAQVPRFELPHRTYYLVSGPVMAATQVRYPNFQGWRNPDLIWPDDRSWFIATDVDFWSLFIGGTTDLTAELSRALGPDAVAASLDDRLVTEI